MKARHLKMVAAGLLAALGLLIAQPTQAQAWDQFEIPEPGAADGWVVTSRTGTLAPLYNEYYTDYVIDAQGHVASVVVGDDYAKHAQTYTYDDQGRIASTSTHETDSPSSAVTSKTDYVYREDGSCVTYHGVGDDSTNGPTWTSFPESPIGNDFGYGGMNYGFRGVWNYTMQNGHVATATQTWNRTTSYDSSGTETRTYSYEFDGEGRVTKMTCDIVTTTGFVDTADEVTPDCPNYSRETSQEVTTYTYNPDGSHRVSVVYDGGRDDYVFNAKGQLVQFGQDVDNESDYYPLVRLYEYDEYGNNVKITDPNRTDSYHGVKMGVRTFTYERIADLAPDVDPDPEPLADTVTVYRLYNHWTGEHLFTTNKQEYDDRAKDGWTPEKIAWYSPASASAGDPVYRIYNHWSGDHYYTADHAEAEQRVGEGWQWDNDGVPIFYSVDPDAAEGAAYPIYQLYNEYATVGTHHWTTKEGEYEDCKRQGWTGEDVKFYASALPPETEE